jgi:hypothetical protein
VSSGLALGISADCRRKVPYDLLGLSLIIGRTDVDLVFVSANRSLSFFVDSTSVPFLAFCSCRLHMIDPIFIVLGQLVYCFLQYNAGDWLTQISQFAIGQSDCGANFVGLVSPALLVMVFLLLVRPRCLLPYLSFCAWVSSDWCFCR